MEENNKFETNTGGTIPVQLTKPSAMEPAPNPMGFSPVQAPPPIQGAPPEKPKKNRTGLVAGILCAAAVVIVIVAGVFVLKSLLGRDPRAQLAKAMANMTEEMASYQSSAVRDIGLAELGKLRDETPMHTNIDMSFTDPNATGRFDHLDVELDGITDYRNKLAECDVSVGTFGINMDIGNVVASGNMLYVRIPMIFQEEVYSLDLTNLGRDFNHSAWSELTGETLPEDYSLTLFSDTKMSEENVFERIFGGQGSSLADSMVFETIQQKREFTLDGTSVKYGGVQVTIDKDAYNEALEALRDDILASDYYADLMKRYETTYSGDFDAFREEADNVVRQLFGIRYEQDVVVDFYLDPKGRIVNISTPQDIAVSSPYSDVDSFAADIDFSGRERTLDSVGGGIYVKSGDEILYLEISRNASITEEFYNEDLTLRIQANDSDDEITFRYTNKWGYGDHSFDLQMAVEVPGAGVGISADGAFTDIVKGESFTFRISHGALQADGEDLLLLTGSITTEPADSAVQVPENATNILEMSAVEIMSLLYGTLF